MISLVTRIFTAFYPPVPEKKSDPVRFGILGAAQAAPIGLILPAKSHPEVVLQAVSARDRSWGSICEEAWDPRYQRHVSRNTAEILDDPNIDAVYIPLPNSLHLEWAVRSIRAGKHVLLEKPSVTNATEAELLFNLPEISLPNAPAVLEAFHNRFHPAIHLFKSFINPADVMHVHTDSMVPWLMVNKDNIGLKYSLGGGCMMMLGSYNFSMLRNIFSAEPEECLTCDTHVHADGIHDKCDYDFKVKFRFPNGGIGEATSTFQGPLLWKPSEARVTHKETVILDKSLPKTQEKVLTQEVTLHGFLNAVVWHRINVKDSFSIRNKADGRPIKKWVESKSHEAYMYKEAGSDFANLPGDDWWMSYRYQLQEFVNKVKGCKTQFWVTREDSIGQMKMIDMAYEKSGLGLRPTSTFR